MKNQLLENLLSALRCLPGVGSKSAQRMGYHLLQKDRKGAKLLSESIQAAITGLQQCEMCNDYDEDTLCRRCSSDHRDQSKICVVEMPTDLNCIEQANCFQGLYFVLMGHFSPLDGIGPRELNIDKLLARASDEKIKEVILATNYTQEGEATAQFLADQLHNLDVEVTRIARGLPVGAELEYSDSATLTQAYLERKQY